MPRATTLTRRNPRALIIDAAERDAHLPRGGDRSEKIDGLASDAYEVATAAADLQHSSLAAGELQNIFHDLRQPARLLIDDRQRAYALVVAAHSLEQQRFGEHPNLRQRRSQLMRHAGDEITSQPAQGALFLQLEDGGDQ